MRVKEIADLAGVTTRTIRHYHHLGLLPVPPLLAGRRDYGLEHLARLLRIRWLVESGLSLPRIRQLLPTSTDATAASVEADLEAAAAEIDSRIAHLEAQRARIDHLIERVRSGERLSPIPTALERFYDDLERLTTSTAGREIMRADRHIMMLLATSGLIPTAVVDMVDQMSMDERAEFARLLTLFGDIGAPDDEGRRPALVEELTTRWLELVERYREPLLAIMEALPTGATGRALWMAVSKLSVIGYPHPDQRATIATIVEHMKQDPDFGPAFDRTAGKDWNLV